MKLKGKNTLLLGLIALSPAAMADTLFTNAAKHGLTFEGLRTATRPAGGYYSAVQIGNDMTGYSAYSPQYYISDDFDVTGAGWVIDQIAVYAFQYQVNNPAIVGQSIEIRQGTINGPVVARGTWKDSEWTSVYRHYGSANDDRRVQKVNFQFHGNPLRPGKYWVTFGLNSNIPGKLSFVPTLTKLNVANIGNCNAYQYETASSLWNNLTNTNGSNPQDVPFEVEGTSMIGKLYTYNLDLREMSEISPSVGTMTPAFQFPVNAPTISSLTYNPRERTFYAASTSTNALYTFDLEGGLDPVGAFNIGSPLIHGIEYVRHLNQIWGVASSSGGDNVYSLSMFNGNATLVGDTGVGNSGFNNLAYHAGLGTTLMTNTFTDKLYSLSNSGVASQVADLSGPGNIQSLAFVPESTLLYGIDSQSDTLWRISGLSGSTQLVANLPSGNYLGLVSVSEYPIKPESYVLLDGMFFGGSLGSLRDSDDDKFYILCDENEPNATLTLYFGHALNNVYRAHFIAEIGSTRDDLNVFVDVYNWSTNTYNTVDVSGATIQDMTIEVNDILPSSHLGPNSIRPRIRWIPQQDIESADGWSVSVDKAEVILGL